jgi:hypothetical protein
MDPLGTGGGSLGIHCAYFGNRWFMPYKYVGHLSELLQAPYLHNLQCLSFARYALSPFTCPNIKIVNECNTRTDCDCLSNYCTMQTCSELAVRTTVLCQPAVSWQYEPLLTLFLWFPYETCTITLLPHCRHTLSLTKTEVNERKHPFRQGAHTVAKILPKYSVRNYFSLCFIKYSPHQEQFNLTLHMSYWCLYLMSCAMFISLATSLYRVIEEEMSIFWEVTVSVIGRKKSSYEHVCNSEWLPRHSCLNLQIQKHCEWR